MSERTRWVHYFADPPHGSPDEMRAELGGKGASLKEMTHAGLNVPLGFTISTQCCQRYQQLERHWPDGLEDQVRQNLARLEAETGRRFCTGIKPLLVSVRSGAAVSMPGMMDTLLNCGLHPGLAGDVGDTSDFWHLYLQFVRTFARIVNEIDERCFAAAEREHGCEPNRALAGAYLAIYEHHTACPFPTGPWDSLVAGISAVFDSWNNDRTVAYRRHHGIRGLPGTAVTVQMMFPSETSGIVFTQDPSDLAADRMTIESSYGLGEAIVSGDVSPDRFVVQRNDRSLVRSELGDKSTVVCALGAQETRAADAPSLTPDQIEQLSRLALRVEQHFGHSIDMEWGYAEGQFALLQSRAICGLDILRDVETGRQAEIGRLRALCGDQRRVWVVHNLAETLPRPTPLSWDIVRRFMTGSGGYGRMYRQFGYRPSRLACDEGFLELICGRVYADPNRLAEMFWDGFPLRYDLDAVVGDRSLLDRGPTTFDPEKVDGRFLRQLIPNLFAMWRCGRRLPRARRGGGKAFLDQVLPPFVDYVTSKRAQDLTALTDEQLMSELHQRCKTVLAQFGAEALAPGLLGGLAYDALASTLVQLMGANEGAALAGKLVSALDGDTAFAQTAMLYEVAKGRVAMQEFLDRFGHRASGEMELAQPRWREDPSFLEQTVQRIRASSDHSPQEIHQRNVALRREAEEQLPDVLKRCGGRSLRERIEENLAQARQLLPFRESGKDYLMMGYELIRLVIEHLAERWGLGGDIYFLHADELAFFSGRQQELREQTAARRVRWEAFGRLEMPDVIDSDHLNDLGQPRPVDSAVVLDGTAVAVGVATGIARILRRPDEVGELDEQSILVCPSTDPGWTPLFLTARGLVVERGGVLSHGAIVARDFGIPAVVCPEATRRLRSGDQIRVDGNKGRIEVMDREATNVPMVE